MTIEYMNIQMNITLQHSVMAICESYAHEIMHFIYAFILNVVSKFVLCYICVDLIIYLII